jgi:hypothetical protein
MKWKVKKVRLPRVSALVSPRAPSNFSVPPMMASRVLGGGAGSLGKAFTPCALIYPFRKVNAYVHSAMLTFSLGLSAGSVATQYRSMRPTFSFPLLS